MTRSFYFIIIGCPYLNRKQVQFQSCSRKYFYLIPEYVMKNFALMSLHFKKSPRCNFLFHSYLIFLI
ncbi:hypothetical protein BpHYR1_042992 [Brachionus plicatilis]|uniref:Uncharacterized protein n=1 Tax=Brachionus plicatilis TaxID=10195 RepID=A0A3M7PP21_BRAPC|nr:hypothetical protein BpHYR1_042992 [Brachionus plicatilis]